MRSLSKFLKIMTSLSPVIYRYVSFYMFSLNNDDNQYKLQIELHYNPSLSIVAKRDIGWRVSGGTAEYGNLGGRYGTR